jgi:hypothetical protein
MLSRQPEMRTYAVKGIEPATHSCTNRRGDAVAEIGVTF